MTQSNDIDEFLEHYGVMGMKWGIRNERRRAAKADKKWQKNIYSVSGAVSIHNAVADKMNNGGLDKFNSQPKYKNINAFDEPDTPLTKQYFREYERLNEKYTAISIKEVYGSSPSGKYKATLDTSTPDWKVKISPTEVKHADTPLPELIIEVNYDSSGYITSSKMVETSMAQSNDIDEFLEHYGILGMKWGIRNRSIKETRARAKREKLANNRRNLSDGDLRNYISRLNEEKQLKRLVDEDLSPGKTIAKRIMSETGQKVARTVISGAALYAIKVVIEKKFSVSDAANYLTPRPRNR